MSFLEGFSILKEARPGFDLTPQQGAVWAALLSDVPPDALIAGAMKLGQESEYPFTVAAWRKCALAFVPQSDTPSHDAAWEDLRKNRKIEMALVYEQRDDVAAHRRKSIRWSNEASRRAAEYVMWRDPNWNAEDMNTIRAQHRGAYLSMIEKQACIDAANDVRAIQANVRRALDGGGQNLLGGGI